MDPITTAIIAAVTAGVTAGVTDVSKKEVLEIYKRLKDLLTQK